MRSANPPTISAGVMIAKVSWNIAKTVSGMFPLRESTVTPLKKILSRLPTKAPPPLKARL